nr:hypothetical protein [uncultured Rhodopila sp.]
MSRLIAACAIVLLLGSVQLAHAEYGGGDDRELPAPDFGWATLGIVLACGGGVAVVRHRRIGR